MTLVIIAFPKPIPTKQVATKSKFSTIILADAIKIKAKRKKEQTDMHYYSLRT